MNPEEALKEMRRAQLQLIPSGPERWTKEGVGLFLARVLELLDEVEEAREPVEVWPHG